MKKHKRIDFVIGIDPGVNTGIAYAQVGRGLLYIESGPIHWAFNAVADIISQSCERNILVVVEDARMRSGAKKKAQGAGSIKRDSKAWDDFLKDLKDAHLVDYQMAPVMKNGTKLKQPIFCQITGWPPHLSTNDHGRDAGMIAWNWAKKFEPTLKYGQ